MATHKYSRQREAIKNFLVNRCDHPTADTIYTCLREEYPNISLGTVYRNLALLTEIGEIARISTGLGPERYDGTVTQHQHFICTQCGRVHDILFDGIDTMIGEAMKSCPGHIDSCTANFYGTCNECMETKPVKQLEAR